MEHGTTYSGTCVEHGWNMSGTCVEHVNARTHRIVRVLYRRDSEDACAQRGQHTPSAGLPEGANVALRSRAGLSISGKRTAIPIAPPPRPSDHGYLFLPIRLAAPFSHTT